MKLLLPFLGGFLILPGSLGLGWPAEKDAPWLLNVDAQESLFSASDGRNVLTPSLREYIRNVTTSLKIPGLAVAVVHAEGETEFGTWGVRSENGDPMTSDTMLTIASCSKAFMSAAMGILIDDYTNARNTTLLPVAVRQFNWETKIKDLLPEDWKLMDLWAEEKANIKDIFAHVSGLPRHDMSYSRSDTPASVLKRLQYLRPAFELREQYSYNNLMYMVGAHIINTYAGGYTKFVEERIFKPLNMSSTYSPKAAAASGKATHNWSPDGRRIPWWFTEEDFELSIGPGGVVASADDLSKWVKMQLHGGIDSLTNTTIIPRTLLEEATSAYVVADGTSTDPRFSIKGYGMGWTRYSFLGHDIVHHTGGIPGITTVVAFAPALGVGVVVLINADGHNAATAMTDVSYEVLRRSFNIAGAIGPAEFQSELPPVPSTQVPVSQASTLDEVHEDIPAFDFIGAYHDDGYGAFVLCNATSTSHYCQQVLSDFKAVDPSTPVSTQLYASYPRLWSTHLRFTHVKDNRFHLKPAALFPHGYGKDTTPFDIGMGEGEFRIADFVVEEGKVVGFGLSGTVDQKTMMQKKGGSVKDTADAWFERV